MFDRVDIFHNAVRAVARTLIGGGGCIFIYSGYARLTSFEINFISKETSRADIEYMNIHPPNKGSSDGPECCVCQNIVNIEKMEKMKAWKLIRITI